MRHMAMTPTPKLFSGSNHIDKIRAIVVGFHKGGGRLIFGTDTGFPLIMTIVRNITSCSLRRRDDKSGPCNKPLRHGIPRATE